MKNKFVDEYLKRALLYDAIIIAAVVLLVFRNREAFLIPKVRNELDNLLSNVISTIVSFTGFILASLTIIVTVKANIKLKSLEDAANGMELLLATRNYKKIVIVFKDAILELVFALLILYVFWMPIINLNSLYLSLIATFGICVIILSVGRTLLVLFAIIFLEFHLENEEK